MTKLLFANAASFFFFSPTFESVPRFECSADYHLNFKNQSIKNTKNHNIISIYEKTNYTNLLRSIN